jgi:hypothetical protein
MASLRDGTNNQVFHIDIQDIVGEVIYATVRLTYQKDEFIDNDTGWATVIEKEFCWRKFELSRATVTEFKRAVLDWEALPLEKLSTTYFSGIWEFCINDNGKCNIRVGLYPETPSKTDWFLVKIKIVLGKNRRIERFHLDRTCLLNFANEIAIEA